MGQPTGQRHPIAPLHRDAFGPRTEPRHAWRDDVARLVVATTDQDPRLAARTHLGHHHRHRNLLGKLCKPRRDRGGLLAPRARWRVDGIEEVGPETCRLLQTALLARPADEGRESGRSLPGGK